jgi:hypothetical protein
MTAARTLALVAFVLGSTAVGADPNEAARSHPPPLADTPAARMLSAWLDAFDGGETASIESFDHAHAAWLPLDRAMDLRARTGGYELLSVQAAGQLWIVFRASEKASHKQVTGRLMLDPANPAFISRLHLSYESSPAGPTLRAADRERLIENAAKALDNFYVFPDVARKMSAALRSRQRHGAYQGMTDGEIFADQLTDDLLAVSRDKHLAVRFSPETVPPDQPEQRPDTDPMVRRRLLASNCGFTSVEHLPPNIGYLKLDEFGAAAVCTPAAIAAMTLLANSDALIIDLRDDHGGAPDMVALLCSYLFREPVHLDDLYNRGESTTRQSWTLPYVRGGTFIDKPVFVLTSGRTFSAAEEFAYDLHSLKRATLIGETTGGGAHAVAPHRLADHFFIEVPFGRFINPITGTDWEGVGVDPDVRVPAAEALEEALRRARGAKDDTGRK